MKQPNEKDLGATIVADHAAEWDKHVEASVVRKTDMILIPLMWIAYAMVYWDKAILGSASVLGMLTDLRLRVVVDADVIPPRVSTSRLSWATSLFYFGMLAGLFPLTYLFQRFHFGRTVGSVVIIWGIVAMSTAGVTTYHGLFAQRFFLGFTESIVPTAFMVIICGFYKQTEQTSRQCLWYSSTGGMTVIGALINYGFAHIHGASLHSWQYLYLTAGSLTVLLGITLLFLPNSPADAWWFSAEEKVVAVERLRRGQMGTRCHKIKFDQIREAALDFKVWLMTIMMGIAYVINGAVSGFGPLIVSTFGWDSYAALLWQMPLGGVCFVTTVLIGYISLKVPNTRLIMLAACCLPVIAGAIMIWKSNWYHHAATPLAGYTLLGFFAPLTSLIVSIVMSNVSGASKKSFAAALTFVFYTIGNIVGPQLVITQTVSKHYPRLWTAVIVCYCLLVLLSGFLYFTLKRENQRRDNLNLDKEEGDRIAFDDLTDKANPYFRYAY